MGGCRWIVAADTVVDIAAADTVELDTAVARAVAAADTVAATGCALFASLFAPPLGFDFGFVDS